MGYAVANYLQRTYGVMQASCGVVVCQNVQLGIRNPVLWEYGAHAWGGVHPTCVHSIIVSLSGLAVPGQQSVVVSIASCFTD